MGHTRQLRDAGITVFELGELHGLRTFRSLITLLGDLLDEPNAAKAYLLDFEEKMNQVSLRRGSRSKIPGLYLSVLGGGLQGGTLGTSFHDVLESAGVFDVAANQYHGWPTYTSEVLLSLKPNVIVTQEGMGESLCRIEGLKLLPACQGRGSIVELPEALLNDPGASIVEAADRLSQAIYPPLTQPK
jgi:iron complex transport system substrate-binding protein